MKAKVTCLSGGILFIAGTVSLLCAQSGPTPCDSILFFVDCSAYFNMETCSLNLSGTGCNGTCVGATWCQNNGSRLVLCLSPSEPGQAVVALNCRYDLQYCSGKTWMGFTDCLLVQTPDGPGCQCLGALIDESCRRDGYSGFDPCEPWEYQGGGGGDGGGGGGGGIARPTGIVVR